MFSAIQFASGNDLHGTLSDQDKVASNTVNRSAKTDRALLNTTQNDPQGQTLSFRVYGLSDTSVLLRLAGTPAPVKSETVNTRAVPVNTKPQRATVACEPPVSVLTEVAKLLQPGRCIT